MEKQYIVIIVVVVIIVAVICGLIGYYVMSSSASGASTTPSTSGQSLPPPTSNFCYRYASGPMRTLFYRSNDCSPKWGWGYSDGNLENENGEGAGSTIKGFASEQPNAEKFCYRYAAGPMRTLFYKAKNGDCSAKWGWGYNDDNLQTENGQGAGGEVWFYTSQQPNTQKYCYRYAAGPMRTLFYKAKDGDCSAKWGWGYNDGNLQNENGQGAGGELWALQ